MTTYTNTLVGTVGSDVTNASSATGGTAFDEDDTPQIGGGASLKFSLLGSRPAMTAAAGATAATARRGWKVPGGAAETQYFRFYFDPGQVTGALTVAVRGMDETSSGQRFRLNISSTTVQLVNSSNAVQWTSGTLSAGTVYRVEFYVQGASSGSAQVKIFVGESTTTVADSGVLTGRNFGGAIQSVWFGATASSTSYNFKIGGPIGWSDSTWLGPVAVSGPTLVTHLATGVPTAGGVTISQKWDDGEDLEVRLVISETDDLASPIYGTATAIDEKGWVKPTITGLDPDTEYFGGVEIDGNLMSDGRFSFRTAPAAGANATFGILFGSSRTTGGGDEAFLAMMDAISVPETMQGIPAFLADLGGNGSPGWTTGVTEDDVLDHLVSQSLVTNVPALIENVPMAYALGATDSGTDKTGPWRDAVIAAYRRAFPHRSLSSSQSALYQSWDWGRVRFIMPDDRTERDDPGAEDTSSKRMWSQEQEDWFVSRCSTWQGAICILSPTLPRLDAPENEGWGAYATQYARIQDRLQAANCLRRIVWLAGGRKAAAASNGSHAGTRGNPIAVGSPFEQTSTDLPSGEAWSTYYNVTPNATMRAYGEAAFEDTGTDSIDFDFIARTTDGTSRATLSKALDVKKYVLWTIPGAMTPIYVEPEEGEEPGPVHKMLVGMTVAPNATAAMVSNWRNVRYMRSFGKDGPDADTLTELAMPGTEKWLTKPSNCILHCSWKDDVEQLTSFLNALVEPCYLTWYHEPHGDITSSVYKATGNRMNQIIQGHPNKALVLGHGPNVTRYHLDEGNGNIASWMYDGVTHIMVDAYNDGPTGRTRYRDSSEMFGWWLEEFRGLYPGIRYMIPEYGMWRLASDTTGSGRAAAIREHFDFLRQQPDIDAIAYWNTTAGSSEALILGTLDAIAYQEQLDAQ